MEQSAVEIGGEGMVIAKVTSFGVHMKEGWVADFKGDILHFPKNGSNIGCRNSKVYFAVEVQYIHGNRLPREGNAVPMFICYCGAGAEAQIEEEGCFVVGDDHNRLWFCKDITQLAQE